MTGQSANHALLDSPWQVALHGLIPRIAFNLRHHHIVLTSDGGNLIHESSLVTKRSRLTKQVIELVDDFHEEPGRIARTIVDARQKDPIDTTAQLAALVERAYPAAWRAKARRHPATRTFQALRMAVNDELGELQRFLDQILAYLPIGGRLTVITFHSLEDRMVKQAMRHWAEGCRCARHIPRCVCSHQPEVRILHKKPVQAGPDELAVNPRASSAKLRAVEKIAEASGS